MKFFKRYTWFILVWVFVVILAGGVVRMTQSGMGCPDWPTCFGKLIPPTSADQLPADFEKYLGKQDIDHTFNVYHTWVEYINRLLGALLGLWILPYVVLAFTRFWKTNQRVCWWALGLLFFTGLIGWTGKVVVDSNLETYQVTIHMLLALIIAVIPLFILSFLSIESIHSTKTLRSMLIILLGLVLVQIVMGTQVRENVDTVSKALNYEQRELWIERLGGIFKVHRSFSWLLLILGLALVRLGRLTRNASYYYSILVVILITIFIGISLNYMGMPAISQPIHLMLAVLLFVQIVYGLLNSKELVGS